MQNLILVSIDFNRDFNPLRQLLHTNLAAVSFLSDRSFMQDLIHAGVDFNPSRPLLHTYMAVSFPSDCTSFMSSIQANKY